MSLAKSDTIDLIALTPDKQRVALVICDVGDIPDGASREHALQRKLQTYVQFVSSGQFLASYPEHGDRGVFIVVSCAVPPTNGMRMIQGVRDHECPEVFLPVEVTPEDDLGKVLGKKKPESKRPWWRS